MISSLLIANRGEIAVRIIRACQELGIRSVVAHSQADSTSLAVKMADDSICIGAAASSQSYLNQNNIISAALNLDVDAIHPGVGFLSENASFAAAVKKNGLLFIGTDAQIIEQLGDKIAARDVAKSLNIPITPGSREPLTDYQSALKLAKEIGFPIMVKAAAGGGGRGIRIVRQAEELEGVLQIAATEAESFFSDGTLFIEKFLEQPRHVEIQILADAYGNVIHLGERDCSAQLKHQKQIEESPSTVLTPKIRSSMGEDAVRLFQHLGYVGAGTVEFLVSQGQYYFMEVNTRVQVEHPVTEMLTGIDIVQQQIKANCHEKLDYSQEDVRLQGHVMECRINAKTPGKVTYFVPPLGPFTRVDTFLENDCMVPPFYDSLLAKVIVQAKDRKSCIQRMQRVLKELELKGEVTTNVVEHQRVLASEIFQSGNFATDIYDKLQIS